MIDIMGQKICIMNTAKTASDLLDGRSAIYSDRPSMVMVNELYVLFIDARFRIDTSQNGLELQYGTSTV